MSLLGNTAAASEAKLASAFQRADGVQPCVLLLRNLHLLLRPGGGGEEDSRLTGALWQLLAGVSSRWAPCLLCGGVAVASDWRCVTFRVAVVATSSSPGRLSAGVAAAFVHQVALQSPTEEQRLAMLEFLSQRLHLGMDVNLETVSKLTTVS